MPKSCDVCQSASALVFCRADAAYLCMGCDVKVHGANKLASRHERVWMCEVCEQSPAVVTCKADAASLCFACDSDIHSANPLASRHERVPVMPFYEVPGVMKLSQMNVIVPSEGQGSESDAEDEERSAAEAESWLISNDFTNNNNTTEKPAKSSGILGSGDEFDDEVTVPAFFSNCDHSHGKMLKGGDVSHEHNGLDFFPDVVDPYLDVEFAPAIGVPTDSIVPVHNPRGSITHVIAMDGSQFVDTELSPKNGYSFAAATLSHSVSSSSLEFGVVPDSAFSDISTPNVVNGTLPQPQTVTQLEPMAREARVMRYKEKRKNRKFEKTIRYASRKAYAETRPPD